MVAKAKSPTKKPVANNKVDYYPNRVAFLTAVTAGVLLVTFALAAVLL